MSLPSPETLLFALWIVTAALAAPLLAGALLGGRFLRAQRRIVRGALAAAPALLIAGLLLPDPLGGRPILSLGDPLAGTDAAAAPAISPGGRGEEDRVDVIAGAGGAAEPTSQPIPAFALPSPAEECDLDLASEEMEELQGPHIAQSSADLAGVDSAPAAIADAPLAAARARSPAGADLAPVRAPGAEAPPAPEAPPLAGALLPSRAAAPRPASPATRSWLASFDPPAIARALLFIWLTGALLQLLRLVGSLGALSRLRRRASALGSTRGVPLVDPRLPPLPVRIIPGLRGAAAVGVLAPEIWLPAHWSARLDRAGLHAVIAHETAHHRERDPLWRLLGALVTALFWPHPLAHLLARREENLSELVADRRVLAAGAGPRRYAELLASLAADAAGGRLALAAGVFGTRSPLERRIRMILSTPSDRAPRDGGWAAPAVLGALCAAVLGISICYPIVGGACDPVDTPTAEVEVVLEQRDGWWQLVGRPRAAAGEKTAPLWRSRLAPVGAGEASLAVDGAFARVEVGGESILIDRRAGRHVELPAESFVQFSGGDGLLDWVESIPCADTPALSEPAEPFAGEEGSDELAEIREAIARIEAELADRTAELERLHTELAARSLDHDRHARALVERSLAGRDAIARDIARANERLAAEEAALAGRPADDRMHQRILLAERRAELARHAAELQARQQEELADGHARLAEEQRELEEEAHENLAERLQELAELSEHRNQLLAERRSLAGESGDPAWLAGDRPRQPNAPADARVRRALELELRALGRELPEHAESLAEAAEDAAEDAADAVEEGLEELLAELHEEMADLHARLDDLPGLLEGLGPQHAKIRRERKIPHDEILDEKFREDDIRGIEIELDRLRGALEGERERNARLEAENRDLRRLIEQSHPTELRERSERRPGLPGTPAPLPSTPGLDGPPLPAGPGAPPSPPPTPAPPPAPRTPPVGSLR